MSASESAPDPTPEPTADERLLIEDARKHRNRQRSGLNFIITLAVGVVFGVLGWLVMFQLRPLVKSIPFLPLGSVTTFLLYAGLAAFALAALCVAGAWLFAKPGKPWGEPLVGGCPRCGNWTLRQRTIEHYTEEPGNLRHYIKGVVTLCATKGCDHATAKVTSPARVR
jgi:heme A synthase